MKRMLKSITIILVAVNVFTSCSTSSEHKIKEPLTNIVKDTIVASPVLDYNDSLWIEINFLDDTMIEAMAYASTTNFIEQKIYPCPRCFLRPEAANALKKANHVAMQKGLKLILFDCYRPKIFQQKMFDLVGDPRYVAEPKQGGSMHNKGLAVDIALADSLGRMLDFGGDFDDFSNKSHHSYNQLDSTAMNNRMLLKNIMSNAGFTPYQYEWWHYNYSHVNYKLDDFVWSCN